MFAIVHHWVANAHIALRRHRAIETFSKLSDLQLRDIGIERFAIEDHIDAVLPWHTFEAAPKAVLQASIQGCG